MNHFLNMIFGFSILENIYFDVHIIAITHLKSSNNAHRVGDQEPARPRDFCGYTIRKHQIEHVCCWLYFHKTYTRDARGPQSRTFQMGYSNDMHIKICFRVCWTRISCLKYDSNIMYKVVIRNIYFNTLFHIQLFNYKSYQILTFIFVISMLENIYFDVHIVTICYFQDRLWRPLVTFT